MSYSPLPCHRSVIQSSRSRRTLRDQGRDSPICKPLFRAVGLQLYTGGRKTEGFVEVEVRATRDAQCAMVDPSVKYKLQDVFSLPPLLLNPSKVQWD